MTAPAESPQPNLLPAALAYSNRFHWPVFPVHGIINGQCTCGKAECARPGKHPIGKLAPRGLLDATLDPNQVATWWREAPYANIGIPTGLGSGLAVLDVDAYKGGEDSLFDLTQRFEPLPMTVQALTGGGGYHYLFAHPGAGVKIRNSVDSLGTGLDVRGDGGYIIVAPSSHSSGRRYEWELSCHPKDTPLAPLPAWLLERIVEIPKGARGPSPSGTEDRSFFQRVNDAAMARLAAWVPNLFPFAKPYHAGYRVTSQDLGRALEEDISIVPEGIVDFGVADQNDPHEGRRTPIALVMEYRNQPAKQAAHWLCARLGAQPIDYGWQEADPPPPPPPYDPPPSGPDEPLENWEALLYRNGRGEVITSPANLETILDHHAGWLDTLVYDDMSYRTLKYRAPPYPGGAVGEWSDADDTWTAIWLERGYGMRPRNTAVAQVVCATAQRRRFHQVRDWLESLIWDGVERLPTFFSDFCGAKQSAYTEAVGRAFFVAAVARVFQPGCKVDTMLVLEGKQGIGKSRLILALFSAAWHIEISYPPGSLDFYQALRGTWCAEFGEMAAFDRAEVARIKQVLTQTQDTYRASYGHHSGSYPRQTIFVGSTNRREWGQDETGMRRFLPVECHDINVEAVAECREQLWAEAVRRYQAQEAWWNIPDAEREQDARFDYDAWEELIAAWIAQRCRLNATAEFSVNDVYQGAIHGDFARNVPPISRWMRRSSSCMV
ncbi:MAG TPA: VapE family protein, partial [Candidatus Competibacteraceae bacterium]|nr:VapE family protein [Candidatus Competibacteraceae bacterium]